MTQIDEIVAYIREHGQLTEREAVVDLGIAKVASRIREMKAAGIPIRSEVIGIGNRRHAVYTMEAPDA